ncbi:hypothetical protein [Arthrobacter sp. SX1312]|uniref:hypothetical protein n=1 Tax=Arthrobacter sp. SX1312 TaxID=2058896 RepID=UPI0011B03D24|nr:hypothetical protein [Arthrobacter sp. SX1312]
MRHTTRSLLLAFGSAAALVATPLALDVQGGTVADHAVAGPGAATTPSMAIPAVPGTADGPPAVGASTEDPVEVVPVTTTTVQVPPPVDAGPEGDLLSEVPPPPPSPQCPITEEGAWWTDPADPHTCLRPGSIPFFEPTPPGIAPELLEPIFEDPPTSPDAGEDCRLTGAQECVVGIMGQDYVVTFADGRPVGVVEAQR